MKNIKFRSSYNLDISSFLNVMSADEYYVNFYRDEFERFYPLLSDEIKSMYSAFLKSINRSNIAVALTTGISLIENFNDRDVKKLIIAQDEIEKNLYKSQFPNDLIEGLEMLPQFAGLIVQLIQELEDNGFRKFWEDKRRPLAQKSIEKLEVLFSENKMLEKIEKYKKIQAEDVTVYVCTYAHPHGTKIFNDSMIIDYKWPEKAIINTFAHELFHPPYKLENVKKAVDILKEKDFVKEAYDNQDPQIAYSPMEGFIEENIVEALGTFIAFSCGFEDEPYKYFQKHDNGSHVISPYLFKYLSDNDIQKEQSFEEYFKEFVIEIDKIVLP